MNLNPLHKLRRTALKNGDLDVTASRSEVDSPIENLVSLEGALESKSDDTETGTSPFTEASHSSVDRAFDAAALSMDPENSEIASVAATVIGFQFNMPKVEGHGEDADPVAVWQGHRGFIAVFDGMGGAGSTTYQRRGVSYSGAYIASRIVAGEMSRLFNPAFPLPDLPLDVAVIQEQLAGTLGREATELEVGTEPSRLKSKLIRRLPTTMAGLGIERKGQTALCQAIWAGDSRCYSLSPTWGLQQLTVDDLKANADALENLKDDSLLSNCVSADGDFELRTQMHEITVPVLMLSATDGCFGYLFSPAHFEFLLLDTLIEAEDSNQWRHAVAKRLRSVAGDDCSMALVALGWPSYRAMKSAFLERHRMLKRDYVVPLDDLTTEINRDAEVIRQTQERKSELEKRREEMRDQLWLRYKPGHDQLLPSREEENMEKEGH